MATIDIVKGIVVKNGIPVGESWSPRKDHGRPKDNQAGLPETRGLRTHNKDPRIVNGQLFLTYKGGSQRIFNADQAATERMSVEDQNGQLTVGDPVGDEVKTDQQVRHEGYVIRDVTLPQREAEKSFRRTHGLGPND